jgi:hypothetical protein
MRDKHMKTALATLILALGLAACSSGAQDDPQAPEFVQADALTASSNTKEASGITAWEFQKGESGSRTIGRAADGKILVDLMTTREPNGCPEQGGELVTITATLPAKGTRSTGCGGKVLTDTLDPSTSQMVDLLLNDLNVAPPPDPTSSQTQSNNPLPPTCPLAFCSTCVPHTDTKCTGVVYWCKDTHQDCSTGYWHPCGVCFGWSW